MLIVISPAKRLDWSEVPGVDLTAPAFPEEATKLARSARRLSRAKLMDLMGISADLAKLNQARFAEFSDAPSPDMLRPAVLAFAGDTYVGLDARSFDAETMEEAQRRLRILSGLYGLLRPRDGIQPYRLEMGSALKTRRGGNLYAFWRDSLAQALTAEATAQGTSYLLNCASQEYFKAADTKALGLTVVTPTFLEDRAGDLKQISFFAKKARGAMARFALEQRVTTPEGLADFGTGGYRHRPELSEPGKPVFVRPETEADAA